MEKGLIPGGESTSHDSGNDILYTVLETGQQVLIEGDEYHLCKAALMSDEIYEYRNKTNKEILDDIYTRSSCMVKEGEANVGDFIICKLAVRDKKKRNLTGTISEIISIMQKEHGCRVVDGAEYEKMKKGGYVNSKDVNSELRKINKEIKKKQAEPNDVQSKIIAFLYKAVKGKSKSGEYNQDDDLLDELGIKHQKFADGGFCFRSNIWSPVTARMSCDNWNNLSVKRDWGLLENGGNIGSSIPEFVAESIYDFDYLLVSEVEKYSEFDMETEKKWGKHDVSLNKITELIKENGIKEPIILQIDFKNNGLIVDGNHRLAAAKRLGLKYIPVRVVYREFGSTNKHKAKKIPQFGFTKISKNEANAKEYKDGGAIKATEKSTIYKEWSSLVNMSFNELKEFYDSEEGKKAGLTKEMADKLGIKSGRESAEWIMKMKKTPYKDWTNEMWEWADRQIRFIKRMRGVSGDLYKNGEKTRKHTSLLIWGHNPEK